MLFEVLQALIYGIVQGITEFLPISSTAHLILLPNILGWEDMGMTFDIALHLGTAVSVLLFFWKDWIKLTKAGMTRPKSSDGKLFWFIMLATIPAGIIGFLFEDFFEQAQKNMLLIGFMLIVLGILLYLADTRCKSTKKINHVNFLSAILIGLSQAVAMIPGVSRSGITITTGRFSGLTRESAARFAFLLSTPTIVGLGIYKIKDIIGENFHLLPFLIAVITSGLVGALVIRYLLDFLKTRSFGIFAVYRIVLGMIVLAGVLMNKL
ncbi:MAG: undecaprenyl-diphosphatase UppP [Clostridiales bacterium 43-6]|nr:MAG: undecaprenyl-diphosphatase UppP [Clostridiales bacterium 43-6]